MSYKPLANEDDHPLDKDEGARTTPLEHFGNIDQDSELSDDNAQKLFVDEKHDNNELFKSVGPGFKIARYILTSMIFLTVGGLIAGSIALIITSPSCSPKLTWWQTTVIYQVYPQSFQDSGSGSVAGYGDLNGIRSRLDYLKDLGIETIWLNPIYDSPMVDNGYDVSDYRAINPLYGTMGDFHELLSAVHQRNMRLLMDFVPNHTSDQHKWFQMCVVNNSQHFCDYYVWRDPDSFGGPPNNWLSVFGGSAWSYVETKNQYYLHQFYPEQPDLNYRNKNVKEEIKKILEYWLDKGVDGFRVDAVPFLLEDREFRNESIDPDYNGTNPFDELIHNYTQNVLGVHAVVQEWRETVDCYSDSDDEKVFIGEVYSSVDTVMEYYGKKKDEFDFPFNFILIEIEEWNANTVKEAIAKWWRALPEGAWSNWVLGNHDNPRIASRVGINLARALNMLLLTLPGTATSYYGDEIGMTNLEDLPDNGYDDRDAERTPMQWNAEENAGFSNSTPWVPVVANYTIVNVEAQKTDNHSMLELYHTLVHLRKNDALKYSRFNLLNMSSENVIGYRRDKPDADNVAIVLINFAGSAVTEDLSIVKHVPKERKFRIAASTWLNKTEIVDNTAVQLGPYEGIVLLAT